jgi:orotidine-5'-phosphate decarboxylase
MSRLIFAADFARVDEARERALALAPHLGLVKIGLELFTEAGPAALGWAREAKLPVFLDLKLHDIPETVERAVERATALGARMLTVHASGGTEMLRRAVRATSGSDCSIVAVTVLTSLDGEDLRALGVNDAPLEQAVRLARLAFDAGVRSFVTSPEEARGLRAALGPEATIITPGVRPASNSARTDDQKRVATPRDAILRGADYVVVGRPIRDAADPVAIARAIAEEIASALDARQKP